MVSSSQSKPITIILIFSFKASSLDKFLFSFSDPCQPHQQYSNTSHNITSHYNIMHQSIFCSHPRTSYHKGDLPSFYIYFIVYTEQAGQQRVIPPHPLWTSSPWTTSHPLIAHGIFPPPLFFGIRYQIHAISRHSHYLTDASGIGNSYFTIILKLACHCDKIYFIRIINYHFEQTILMVSIRCIIPT